MGRIEDEDLFQRTWYLPDRWWTWTKAGFKRRSSWDTILKRGNASRWDDLERWKQFPCVFLVNKPLTFGHSQLIVPRPLGKNSAQEQDFFGWASQIIEHVIQTFVEAFGEEKERRLYTKSQFDALAERTCSYGKYIKTLVMRVSADEDQRKKYKVHLVPYFESNAALCQERYCSIHKASPDKTGGLIGWLGERETEVDKWRTGDFKLIDICQDVWRLPRLAHDLRELWPRQQRTARRRTKPRA
jgi:hypothetical protein